jgi:hypothetical protein
MGRESACDLFYRLPCVLANALAQKSNPEHNRRSGRGYLTTGFCRTVGAGGKDLGPACPYCPYNREPTGRHGSYATAWLFLLEGLPAAGARIAPQRLDCVAGVVRLELKNESLSSSTEVVEAGGIAAPWCTRLTAIWHGELSHGG